MNLPFTDADGNKGNQIIYGMLEEIKLFRYVFPKEHLSAITKSLGLPSSRYSKFNAQAILMRKAMNAKKIPTPPKDTKTFPIFKDDVAIKEIGIKEDVGVEEFGFNHEGL